VVVENKPGANATLAGDLVSKAAPDGLTIWFAASPPLTIGPNIMKKMAFDPARDITPIAPVLSYANVLVVGRDLPQPTLKDLMAFAKANPARCSTARPASASATTSAASCWPARPACS
jgi:tripartite-type tricarboxylate transporter receptor subunit TctC